MKNVILLLLCNSTAVLILQGQVKTPGDGQRKAISSLINQYSQAMEKRDTALLKTILNRKCRPISFYRRRRNGIGASVEGMLKSSAEKPGTRTLTIDKIRMLNANSGIVDCKYEIQNTDGTIRKMWSTFIVVSDMKIWKISAIRNMLPGSQ